MLSIDHLFYLIIAIINQFLLSLYTDNTTSLWADTVKQMSFTTHSLLPLVKNWSVIIEEQIDIYTKELVQKTKGKWL